MKNKDGTSYNCYLPVTEETKTVKTGAFMQNSSNAFLENDKKILKTPDELLDVLKDEGCLYRVCFSTFSFRLMHLFSSYLYVIYY
jgi:hypothetical protein